LNDVFFLQLIRNFKKLVESFIYIDQSFDMRNVAACFHGKTETSRRDGVPVLNRFFDRRA
jgi:hypothetical protein